MVDEWIRYFCILREGKREYVPYKAFDESNEGCEKDEKETYCSFLCYMNQRTVR